MAVNYEDQRFQDVKAEEQQALANVNQMYDNMVSESNNFYQSQIDAAKEYGDKQAEIQQANTDFAIEQINQQKEQAQKDYVKEQKGAYVDWQKQSNPYGAEAEKLAQNGLLHSGYGETSQVAMYTAYQNRLAQARDTYNKAVLNYDNGIKEAQLTNNAALAEISYNALKTQLALGLEGFQYKNQLLQQQLAQQNEVGDRYYSRWKDVLNQINTENALAEQQRQFNASLSAKNSSNNTYTVSNNSKNSGSSSGSVFDTIANGVANSLKNAASKSKNSNYKETDYVIQDANGNTLPVYESANGSLYYYDGNEYKLWSGSKGNIIPQSLKGLGGGGHGF
jgi:hypothetical protein